MTSAMVCALPLVRRGVMGTAMVLALAACDVAGSDPAGAVSPGEAQALADAAAMLDETRSLPDAALPRLDAPDVSETPAQDPVANTR